MFDIDSDGDLDILNYFYYEASWWENDGNQPPEFTEHIYDHIYDGYAASEVADINNDGFSDILVAGGDALMGQTGWIRYYLNDGEQNFTEYLLVDGFYGPKGRNCFTPVDMDQDGDIDVLGTAWWHCEVAWFENRLITLELEPFSLLEPAQGDTLDSAEVSMSWTATSINAEREIRYAVLVSEDLPDNFQLAGETGDTTFIFTGEAGMTCFWRVKAVAELGPSRWCEEQNRYFVIRDLAVDPQRSPEIPTAFRIASISPNPFNASTTITIALPAPSTLAVAVYNLSLIHI